MPFEKNDPNIDKRGRPANPDKVLEKVIDLMERSRFHPAKELIKMYRNTNLETHVRAKILLELLKYVEGKKADQKEPPLPKKPISPEESRKNAETQAELIKKLEADAQKKAE